MLLERRRILLQRLVQSQAIKRVFHPVMISSKPM
jgi:hypothetical protein